MFLRNSKLVVFRRLSNVQSTSLDIQIDVSRISHFDVIRSDIWIIAGCPRDITLDVEFVCQSISWISKGYICATWERTFFDGKKGASNNRDNRNEVISVAVTADGSNNGTSELTKDPETVTALNPVTEKSDCKKSMASTDDDPFLLASTCQDPPMNIVNDYQSSPDSMLVIPKHLK
ncbi:hypothetical protein DAPPUDRAFT_116124 [Daphnia pulex]|uniref:Uncharacterized protein n=1 Tax=Daphnia pulex TaxID=6669 RepID=E9HNM4_DAPPU|nr:hypothetical protein DAPPUDRAFT_116124 [Daphnia pulex]|eukprot:EFX66658.1 hypothetical protein DAPPUDRAFT_116124 [Daphnia pulex]